MKRTDKPDFGTLADIKVVLCGVSIASPFAAELLAENGADVIWIENPRMPDPARSPYSFVGVQDRRNMRALSLNLGVPGGKQVFLRLLKDTDILIEASRGGTFDEWGLDDQTMWKSNPALVIVHVSGYGQTGAPEYVGRASWDGVGQAFGGYMNANGNSEPEPPLRVGPMTCDYITALNACWSALAGLHRARLTGEGESVDIAQFEVMVRALYDYPHKYINWHRDTPRNGNTDAMITAYAPYKCKDGKYIFAAFVGATAMTKGLPLLGFEWGTEDFPKDMVCVRYGTDGSKKFEARFTEWCAEHTADEAERTLIAAGVSCSQVMGYEDMLVHPHYKERQVFTEWDDSQRGHIKGINFIPKFTQHPQQLWRPMPAFGADNIDILDELGYSQEEVQKLAESKAIIIPQPEAA